MKWEHYIRRWAEAMNECFFVKCLGAEQIITQTHKLS